MVRTTFLCLVVVGVSLFTLFTLLPGSNAKASSKRAAHANGEKLYMANCEACHMLGSNVIKPEKELVTSNKLASRKLFNEYLSKKHGAMPAFELIATNEKDSKDLYAFVRALKNQSWDYSASDEHKDEAELEMPQPPSNAQ